MEVYRVGVAISMTSNASAVLGGLGSDLLSLGRQASAVELDLKRVRTAVRETAASGIVGLRGMASLVNNARELNYRLALMKSVGMPHSSMAAANAAAERVPMQGFAGTSGSTRSFREECAGLGTAKDREVVLPDVAQAAVVLSKVLDLREPAIRPAVGQISPKQLIINERNMALKSIDASNGRVDQERLRNAVQTTGPTAPTMEDGTRSRRVAAAIIGMGGHMAGTLLTAAGRQLDAGVMAMRNAAEMTRLKRVDPLRVQSARGGHIAPDPHFSLR